MMDAQNFRHVSLAQAIKSINAIVAPPFLLLIMPFVASNKISESLSAAFLNKHGLQESLVFSFAAYICLIFFAELLL